MELAKMDLDKKKDLAKEEMDKFLANEQMFHCQRFSCLLARSVCLSRQDKPGTWEKSWGCENCAQGKEIRAMECGEDKEKNESRLIQPGLTQPAKGPDDNDNNKKVMVCQECQKEIINGDIRKGKCRQCYGKNYRREKKEKMQAKAKERVQAEVDQMMAEHERAKEQAKQSIGEIGGAEIRGRGEMGIEPTEPLMVRLDFSEYPDLLNEIKKIARDEFRTIELQMMYLISSAIFNPPGF